MKKYSARAADVADVLGPNTLRAKPRVRPNKSEKWKRNHANYIAKHGLSDVRIAELVGDTEFLKHLRLTERERHLAAMHYVQLRAAGNEPNEEDWFLQIEQGGHRCPRCENLVPCVTPSGVYLWTRAPATILDARQLAGLQGISRDDLESTGLITLRPRLLQDLIGNAFSAPVCGVIFLELLASAGRAAARREGKSDSICC